MQLQVSHYLTLVALLLLLKDVKLDAQIGIFAFRLDVPHNLQQFESCDKVGVKNRNIRYNSYESSFRIILHNINMIFNKNIKQAYHNHIYIMHQTYFVRQ